jgi:hypothetical protein
MKNFSDPAKLDSLTEERVRRIVDLSRRRDRILEAPTLDLEALAALTADYEAANMPCAAADLRRRLTWYQGRSGKRGREEVEKDSVERLLPGCLSLAFGSGNGKEVEAWVSGEAVLNGRRGKSKRQEKTEQAL